jgi:predicted  nucleic acid-binding Zn-ribbon protein
MPSKAERAEIATRQAMEQQAERSKSIEQGMSTLTERVAKLEKDKEALKEELQVLRSSLPPGREKGL